MGRRHPKTPKPKPRLAKLLTNPGGRLKLMNPTKFLPKILIKKTIIVRMPAFKHTRFSKVNLAVFILIFGAIGAYALFHSSAVGPNVWVATTGNDSTCIRNDSSKPCATFQKACTIAQGGDIVSVANGSYAPQVVTCTPSSNITFQ